MGVARRFVKGQHRRETGVAAFEQRTPFVTRAGKHQGLDGLAHLGPEPAVVLALDETRVQADEYRQFGKKLRLQRAQRDVQAVGRLVGVVERRAAVEQVVAARPAPLAAGLQAIEDRGQRGAAVHHGGVDHLAAAGTLALEECSHDAKGQVERSAAVVANQVERRHRPAAVRADGVQGAAECDVVQVVPGRARQRASLTETRHAANHQARVPGVADIRAQAQTFQHAGAETFDQHVGAVQQAQRGVAPGRRLQVQCHRAPAACVDVETLVHRQAQAAGFEPVDAHHVGAQVGQQHAAHRAGADAREFDHPQSLQWSHGLCLRRLK
jgi:hypothetical protein